jgi:hypothetical protein
MPSGLFLVFLLSGKTAPKSLQALMKSSFPPQIPWKIKTLG